MGWGVEVGWHDDVHTNTESFASDPWLLEHQNRKHDEYIACICKTSKILNLLPSSLHCLEARNRPFPGAATCHWPFAIRAVRQLQVCLLLGNKLLSTLRASQELRLPWIGRLFPNHFALACPGPSRREARQATCARAVKTSGPRFAVLLRRCDGTCFGVQCFQLESIVVKQPHAGHNQSNLNCVWQEMKGMKARSSNLFGKHKKLGECLLRELEAPQCCRARIRSKCCTSYCTSRRNHTQVVGIAKPGPRTHALYTLRHITIQALHCTLHTWWNAKIKTQCNKERQHARKHHNP